MGRDDMSSLGNLKAALGILLEDMDRRIALRLGANNLLAVAGGFVAGLAPLALKGVVDAATAVTPNQALPRYAPMSVSTWAAAYLLCICFGRLLAELRPLLASAAEQRLYGRLRLRFLEHALELPLDFHLSRRPGALAHTLQQGVTGYQIILVNLANGILPVLVETLTVTLILLSLKQTALTFTFVLTAMAYFVNMRRSASGLRISGQAVATASIDANGILADGFINFEPLKCFGNERGVLRQFARSIGVLEGSWRRLQGQRLRGGLVGILIFTLSMSASLALSIQALTEGTLTIGGFVLASMYMAQVLRPLEMLATAVRDISQGLAFIRPLIDVFNTPAQATRRIPCSPSDETLNTGPNTPDSTLAHPRLRPAPEILFQDVDLAFDSGEPVLKRFSLQIPAGRSTAIVGASGCGKSSLIRLLLRLCEPDAGSILLDGTAIDSLPIATLRSMIAVVPQDTVLFNTTIAANIAIGRENSSLRDIERAARLARLHEFVTALPCGYDTIVGERGLKLSGGERQRIAIARAILRDPLIYVFDEATSMLDGPTELAILQSLKDISAGRTTITIAHRLSSVQDADEIVVLHQGKVAEQGPPAALLARGGVYAAMWQAQHLNLVA